MANKNQDPNTCPTQLYTRWKPIKEHHVLKNAFIQFESYYWLSIVDLIEFLKSTRFSDSDYNWPSFTGFLPSFTDFYLVLLGFT